MLRFASDALYINGFMIRYYGVCILLGVLLALIIAVRREKRYALEKDTSVNLVLICVPVGIVCARLYYCAFEWRSYINDPLSVLDIRSGGLAIYGGLIGAFIAGYIYSRAKKLKYLTLTDLAAPCVAAAQALGRWGNFFNQEAYGGPSASWARFFPLSVYIDSIAQWRYATFFYESFSCALIALTLLLAERKGAFKRRGDVFFWYVLLYACERCFVEGMRSDSLYMGAFRVSQLLSALGVLAVSVLFARRNKGKVPIGAICACALLISVLIGAPQAVILILAVACLAANARVYALKATFSAK